MTFSVLNRGRPYWTRTLPPKHNWSMVRGWFKSCWSFATTLAAL